MKKVGTSMYVHKSNLQELLNKLSQSESDRINQIIIDFDKNYQVVKYNNGNVSLIDSPDWNISNEPIVGDSYCIHPDGIIKVTKSSNKIYHNKWQFVSSDYDGFDIEAAKQRTSLWNSIPNIKIHKSRIGNKGYWENLLRENNIII